MIVVVGRVRTDAGKRAALVRVGQRVASASRQEPGNLSYQVCQDTEDEYAFVFVEQWESEEALQAHFGTAHVAELMAAIPTAIVEPPDVKFHTVAGSRDLSEVGAG